VQMPFLRGKTALHQVNRLFNLPLLTCQTGFGFDFYNTVRFSPSLWPEKLSLFKRSYLSF
jgi:hypothetical protein